MMLILLAVLLSFAAVVAVLAPFWLTENAQLDMSSTITDLQQGLQMRQAIIATYVREEVQQQSGQLLRWEWDKRRDFLQNRYLDIARRIEYLQWQQRQKEQQ
jgi:hypothetical protein